MKVPKNEPEAAAGTRPAKTPRDGSTTSRVRSETLLGETGVIIIEHGGREYRLRQTRTGKLILTA